MGYPNAKYLWIDLETTGLDPEDHVILEWAVIVTDGTLAVLGDYGGLISWAGRALPLMNDVVWEMHKKNMLLHEVLEHAPTRQTEQYMAGEIRKIIEEYTWIEKKPILAGSTVHFDRTFLLARTVGLGPLLHHRHLDVSSLKLAVGDAALLDFPKNEAHRAAADVRESLEHARRIYWMLSIVGSTDAVVREVMR